jgi:hypothetical protein
MTSPLGVGASRFHTGGEEGSVDTVYLGVFDKAKLIEAGGYDERFIRAQDWELNLRLRERGGVVWFSPDLKVAYRPRSSLRALAKQYFEYGRWRRVVIRKNRTTLNLRYLAPPVAFFGSLQGVFMPIRMGLSVRVLNEIEAVNNRRVYLFRLRWGADTIQEQYGKFIKVS